jgi:selenide, water dikinase
MRRLLLIGGGHSHVEVLRRFGLAPEPGTELVLVSPQPLTGYSGMLPGLIAGHYTTADAHIDLVGLARDARCRIMQTAVNGMHFDARLAFCDDGSTLEYDIASIDIGSRPGTLDVPGAAAHSLGVKPIERFMRRWTAVLERARAGKLPDGFRIAVVGGGAAGVETLLAMQHRMNATGSRATFALLSATEEILPAHPPSVQRIFRRVLNDRGIALHAGHAVNEVDAHSVCTDGGGRIGADLVVWATGASAPFWPRACGLAVDDQGFIRVEPTLQSVNRTGVFASGDIATIDDHARPKSGVFAVRQGPLLAGNLRRALRGAPLHGRVPQRQALALISTGDRHAVASRGWLTLEGDWVWRWKDWIDRRFMRRYRAPDAASGEAVHERR